MLQTLTCVNEIDYSEIVGDRILPFRFTLNLQDSVLYPEAGQSQRFCYDITGEGEDELPYADLSHFLLGICDLIEEEDIDQITVTIDGEPQTVVWGENVEIKTVENPDPPTGCIGLKFDFPLAVNGNMQVCISLLTPYAIGPINVCLFGANTTATGLTICGPVCGTITPCESVFYQNETVCVPVTVTPYAVPGIATATCCGDPQISTTSTCTGTRRSCTFTISQALCIEIPISFGADIETGAAVVDCGTPSETPCECEFEAPAVSTATKTARILNCTSRKLFK